MAGDPVAYPPAAMRWQPNPDAQHVALLDGVQPIQELNLRFVVEGARMQLEEQVRIAVSRSTEAEGHIRAIDSARWTGTPRGR